MTGRRFEVGYGAVLEEFAGILESRKEGLGGSWFNAPGESSRDAFMRRLKKSDPAHDIFELYAQEHEERWAGATELSVAEAQAQMGEIERKYKLECAEYDNVLFGVSDEFAGAAKLEQEQIAKLIDVGGLQAQLDSGALVAVEDGKLVKDASAVAASVQAFESQRDKAVDAIMATKIALDKKK